MSVHVKYLDMTRSELNADVLIAALLGAGGYSIGTENGVSTITNTTTGEQAVLQPGDESKVPQAFLSYAFVDQDYLPVDAGFVQVSTAAAVDPSNMRKAHEQLTLEYTATKAGYLDVSLSLGEETKNIDVYYDDFTVTHQHGPIVQADDYMPFGLTFNSYQREGVLKNKYTFQGQEVQDDLDLGWVQFKWRNHDPALARFFNVDPLAHEYVYNSPYAFSENKVTSHIELEGLESIEAMKTFNKNNVIKIANSIRNNDVAMEEISKGRERGKEFGKLGLSVAPLSFGLSQSINNSKIGGGVSVLKIDGSTNLGGDYKAQLTGLSLNAAFLVEGNGLDGNAVYGQISVENKGISVIDAGQDGPAVKENNDVITKVNTGPVESEINWSAGLDYLESAINITGAIFSEWINETINKDEKYDDEIID